MTQTAHIRTSVLDIAYEDNGPAEALPVVLLHGYPYDVRSFDEVVPIINSAGYRTVVPYLRRLRWHPFSVAGNSPFGRAGSFGAGFVGYA